MAWLRRKMVWLRRVVARASERALEKELEKIAEKLTGRRCRFVKMICNEPKNFELNDIYLSVRGKHAVFGVAVVENPEFWASPWWRDDCVVRFEGKYVVMQIDYAAAVWAYALLRIIQ